MASIGDTPSRIPLASRSTLSFSTPSFLMGSPSSTHSYTSSTGSSSSKTSFKSLRSLLPFGPNQTGERKGSFGSADKKKSLDIGLGKKSMDMGRNVRASERKSSLQIPSSVLAPVISIDKQEEPSFTEQVRRSISLTTLEKERYSPLREPFTPLQSTPLRPPTFREPLPPSFIAPLSQNPLPPIPFSAPASLPPSPKPSLSRPSSMSSPSPSPSPLNSVLPNTFCPPSPPIADLSTIIEADTSGVSLSRHLPSPSPAPSEREPSTSEADESHLDLSTSHLDAQVRDAMGSTPGWGVVDEPSLSADFSLDMDTISPDVAALLSPNNLAPTPRQQSSLPRLRPSSSATPPQQPSPRMKTAPASPGSTGRVSPHPPPSPLRPSNNPNSLMKNTPYSGESSEPPPPSSIYPPVSSSRPSLDIPRPSLDMSKTAFSAHRSRKRSMSTTTPSRSGTSMSTAGSVEWLGPRTAKAFKAAGLLDETLSKDSKDTLSRATHPRRGSVGDGRHVLPHDSKYTSPDPTQRLGTLSRFGSVRSDRSASRMSSSRRSPSSFTESPRSVSTAPSSVAGWEDDTMMKHAMEMSALLGALSDSQRTARILREENTELRERLDGIERERDVFERERDEALDLLREREQELMARDRDMTRATDGGGDDERVGELEEENAILRSVVDDLRREIGEMLRAVEQPPAPSPRIPTKVFSPPNTKRYSAASSIFPAPPANMSMLLTDEWERDSEDVFQRRLASGSKQPDLEEDIEWTKRRNEPTWVRHGNADGWTKRDRQMSISMETADLSIFSDNGSEVSLRLKPEHELHLGDMDDMSLYEMNSRDGL